MAIVSATRAKQNFAAILDQAQREPVRIQRHERDVAVVMSAAEYERIHGVNVQELIRLSDENGKYAAAQGMTDELLSQMLAEE